MADGGGAIELGGGRLTPARLVQHRFGSIGSFIAALAPPTSALLGSHFFLGTGPLRDIFHVPPADVRAAAWLVACLILVPVELWLMRPLGREVRRQVLASFRILLIVVTSVGIIAAVLGRKRCETHERQGSDNRLRSRGETAMEVRDENDNVDYSDVDNGSTFLGTGRCAANVRTRGVPDRIRVL